MDYVNPIGPVQRGRSADKAQGTVRQGKDGPSFKETLQGFMKDVNQMQLKADESIRKMAAGEINDVHQVMNAVEEANLAFNMMMEIRNKVMDAYDELMRIRT